MYTLRDCFSDFTVIVIFSDTKIFTLSVDNFSLLFINKSINDNLHSCS